MPLHLAPGGTRHLEASSLRDSSNVSDKQPLNPLGGLPINLERSTDPMMELDPDIPLVDLPSVDEDTGNGLVKKVVSVPYIHTYPDTLLLSEKYNVIVATVYLVPYLHTYPDTLLLSEKYNVIVATVYLVPYLHTSAL